MAEKYALNRISLRFADPSIESLYRDYIRKRTLPYCRIAWAIVVFLAGSFAFLDRPFFGANGNTVLSVRFLLVTLAIAVLILSFSDLAKKFYEFSSFLFVTLVGGFCVFLIGMSDPTTFSPYFAGLFYAFTGIFSTTGFGFRFSFLGLILNLILCEIVITLLVPLPTQLLLIYNFFLPGMLIIFIYVSYMTERISRENFQVSLQLTDSLANVRKLSGLLPICAKCKKIRDDEGYWNQIESYIRTHSEADFSHSICPDCARELYPDLYKDKILPMVQPGTSAENE